MGALSGSGRVEDEVWVFFRGNGEIRTHGILGTTDKDQKAEVQAAFELFKGGAEGPITFKDLRRVAGELKENVTDDQLRDMLSEASNSHSTGGVDL